MMAEVTDCFVLRGTDSRGGPFITREFIWPSCDSPEHRKYLKLQIHKKADRMNKAGANVSVQFQTLGDDGLWKDSELQPFPTECIVRCVSSCQKRQVESLLLAWRHIGPGDYGEFDPMDMLATNRGWHPLTAGEEMSVGIGGKRYKIIREE